MGCDSFRDIFRSLGAKTLDYYTYTTAWSLRPKFVFQTVSTSSVRLSFKKGILFIRVRKKLFPFKIHVRRTAGRGYSCFHLYMCFLFVYFCHASWPNDKQYWLEIRCTYSPRPYLNTVFFSKKMTLRATSPEKLPGHVNFPHISSIALFPVILNA